MRAATLVIALLFVAASNGNQSLVTRQGFAKLIAGMPVQELTSIFAQDLQVIQSRLIIGQGSATRQEYAVAQIKFDLRQWSHRKEIRSLLVGKRKSSAPLTDSGLSSQPSVYFPMQVTGYNFKVSSNECMRIKLNRSGKIAVVFYGFRS